MLKTYTLGNVGGDWWKELDALQVKLTDIELRLKVYQKLNDSELEVIRQDISNVKTSIQTLSNNMSIELSKKANKVQEDWKTLDMLNGYVNDTSTPLRYRKNELGNVEIYGRVSGANKTSNTIAVLPVGYRPKVSYIIPVVASGFAQAYVSGNGSIVMSTESTSASINFAITLPTT